MAVLFQDHVLHYGGTMEDAEGILRLAKNGVIVNVMDEEVMKEIVTKRVERNAAKKRRRQEAKK